jgi:hypothetical protein
MGRRLGSLFLARSFGRLPLACAGTPANTEIPSYGSESRYPFPERKTPMRDDREGVESQISARGQKDPVLTEKNFPAGKYFFACCFFGGAFYPNRDVPGALIRVITGYPTRGERHGASWNAARNAR